MVGSMGRRARGRATPSFRLCVIDAKDARIWAVKAQRIPLSCEVVQRKQRQVRLSHQDWVLPSFPSFLDHNLTWMWSLPCQTGHLEYTLFVQNSWWYGTICDKGDPLMDDVSRTNLVAQAIIWALLSFCKTYFWNEILVSSGEVTFTEPLQ